MLRALLHRIRGREVPPFYTRDALADFAARSASEIGRHSYGRPAMRWWGERAKLIVGRYCSIADDVTIFLGGNHRVDWVTTYPFSAIDGWPEAAAIAGHPATKGDVRIGNDVWIGDGAAIMSGVTVGNGAVIAARAVVLRDVPPYGIVGGNPAKLLRQRFEDHQIEALERIAWWDWPDEKVRAEIPHLLQGDIDAFIARHLPGG